jgi:bacillithiol biosynthesis deacetylase BshB1
MKLDILAISAHPDDVEVSAGGTLLHHVALGKKVGLLDLTRAELSTRGNVVQRAEEAHQSCVILGAVVRDQMGLPDGFFNIDQTNLLKLVAKIRFYQPELILANSVDDRHPDHQRAANLVEQAVFLANLVKVETQDESGTAQRPWRARAVYHYVQDRTCQPDFVVDISPYIEQKFEAIRAYKSQFYQPDCTDPETPISCPSFFEALRGRNAMLGRQIGVEYAEAFTSTRPVGIRDLFDLV